MNVGARRLIWNQNDYPWRNICFLEAEARLDNTRRMTWTGTGIIIARRTVLTALHNLYKGVGDTDFPHYKGPADIIKVTPGGIGSKFGSTTANSSCFRFSHNGKGVFDAVESRSHPKKVMEHDYGAIILPQDSSLESDSQYPQFKFYPNEELPQLEQMNGCEIVGYPFGEKGIDYRGKLYAQRGHLKKAESNRLRYDYETDSGDSGGPIFDNVGFIVGIHSRETTTPYVEGWGRRITSDMKEELKKWIVEGGGILSRG